MVRKSVGIPTFAMYFEHPDFPGVTAVQIAADSQCVVVAYLNHLGNALDVREFYVKNDPELSQIVKFTYFDDVWDLDMVMELVDPVDPELPCPALEPHIPAYLQSLEAAAS